MCNRLMRVCAGEPPLTPRPSPLLHRGEAGQQMVLVSLMLPILLVFVGLVVDVGNVFVHRRMAQNAADAAAMAGSTRLSIGQGSARTTALAYAASNNYGNDAVTVFFPTGCIEVQVNENVRPLLASLIWDGTFDVGAKSVACMMTVPLSSSVVIFGKDDHDGAGKYTMDSALYLNGNSTLRVNHGTIHINSSSSEAVTIKGQPRIDTLTPATIGCDPCKLSTDAFNHEPIVGIQKLDPDPLAALPAPSKPTKTKCSSKEITQTKDLTSGIFCYTNGISLKNKAVLDLPAGEYWIEGDIASKGTITGKNVMLYITDGDVDLSGCYNCVLSPPNSGIYSGITFFGARNEEINFDINGGKSVLDLNGIIYSKKGSLQLGGNAALLADFAVNSVELKGTSNLTVEGFNSTNWGTTEYRMTE